MKKPFIHSKNIFILILILIWASALRFLGLQDQGFRFSDEGYYFLHPIYLVYAPGLKNYLYYNHGLCWLTSLPVRFFGPDYSVALTWSALLGILTIVITFWIVKELYNTRTALLSALLLASSKYILFYHRSNMSDGYGLLCFSVSLFLFIRVLKAFHLEENHSNQKIKVTLPGMLYLVLFALLSGFTFTVRNQSFVTLLGMAGSFGCCLFFYCFRNPRNRENLFWYFGITLIALAGAILTIYLFLHSLGDKVNWTKTIEWYWKTFDVAKGELSSLQPFFIQHLFRYNGIPFIAVGILGIGWELKKLRKGIDLFRLWILISFFGLLLSYIKTPMPWPRGHVYGIYFLSIFWGVGMDNILALAKIRKSLKLSLATVLILAMMGTELIKAKHLIQSKSGYRKVCEFILKNDPVDIRKKSLVATHSWPIIACYYGKGAFTAYDLAKDEKFETLCEKLIKLQLRGRARFMVLDYNVSHFASSRMNHVLQEFVLTYPPDLLVRNDSAKDAQTIEDTFMGNSVRNDIFSDRIIVYDLSLLSQKITSYPTPLLQYSNDEDMLDKFYYKYENFNALDLN